MWCEKCHFGSENVEFRLDQSGIFNCPQCKSSNPPLYKSPFIKIKSRTLHGKSSSVGSPPPKKFKFDQKGGSDSDNPAIT